MALTEKQTIFLECYAMTRDAEQSCKRAKIPIRTPLKWLGDSEFFEALMKTGKQTKRHGNGEKKG